MPSDRIIGRTYEQAIIKRCLENEEAQLIALYGRRRVGKTFLIKEYFNDQFDFVFTGMFEASRDVLCCNFKKELKGFMENRVSDCTIGLTRSICYQNISTHLTRNALWYFLTNYLGWTRPEAISYKHSPFGGMSGVLVNNT